MGVGRGQGLRMGNGARDGYMRVGGRLEDRGLGIEPEIMI